MREDIVNSVINQYNTKKENQIDNNPAVSNNQKVENQQKGFAGALQNIVNAFENSIIGKVFKAPSNVMKETYKKLDEGESSAIGDLGVLAKGSADAVATALRSGGTILQESWKDIGKVGDTEMAQEALGKGGANIIKGASNVAGFASSALANSLMFQEPVVDLIDKGLDITALTGDVLALTDGKTSVKDLVSDAIYTTLDFAPEISKSFKGKNISDKAKDSEVLKDITKKNVSLKASEKAKEDAINISNKSYKKFLSNLATSETGDDFVKSATDSYKGSQDTLNNLLENTDPKNIFKDKTFNDFNTYLLDNVDTKSTVKTNQDFISKLSNKIDDIVAKPNTTMTQINELFDNWSSLATAEETLLAEKKLYTAALNFLEDNYPKEIKEAIENYRVDNAVLTIIENEFNKADKKQLLKEIKDISTTLPEKMANNFYIGVMGGQAGVFPSKQGIKENIVDKIFTGREGEKLFNGLKKEAFKTLPTDKLKQISNVLSDKARGLIQNSRGIIESTYPDNIEEQTLPQQTTNTGNQVYTPKLYKSEYQQYLDSLYY